MAKREQIHRWKKQLANVQAAIEKLLKGERLPGVELQGPQGGAESVGVGHRPRRGAGLDHAK